MPNLTEVPKDEIARISRHEAKVAAATIKNRLEKSDPISLG
jgi:hypothetical protein